MDEYGTVLYDMLDRWPKIAALLAEAKTNPDLEYTLKQGSDSEIKAALRDRDITQKDLEAFKEDIDPWLGSVAQRSWYMPPMAS